jgi:hypothetical protein
MNARPERFVIAGAWPRLSSDLELSCYGFYPIGLTTFLNGIVLMSSDFDPSEARLHGAD